MTSKYKACIFDLDGTLLDSMIHWRQQNIIFLEERGLEAPEEIRDHILDVHSSIAAKLYIEKFHLDTTVQEIVSEYEQRMFYNYTHDVIPMKRGLPEFFDRLKAQGIRMCVATMTPSDVAQAALAHHGLLDYMEFVTSTYEIGMSKAQPEFFPSVLERLQLDASECVVFEDALYAANSAHAAGIDVFGIYDYTARNDREEMVAVCARYVEGFDEFFAEDGGLTI